LVGIKEGLTQLYSNGTFCELGFLKWG